MRDAVRLRRPQDTVLDSPATRRHLDETVRIWLGLPNDAGVEIPRLPDELARLFLRVEEYERPHRDSYGCWEFGFSENFRSGRLWEPEVDQWLADRRRELSERMPLEPSWPDGRPFAVCLTHDVDLVSAQSTLPQVLRFMRAGLAEIAHSPGERLVRLARPPVRAARALRSGVSSSPSSETTLELSVAVEKEYGVVGSYFFAVYPAQRRSRYDCVYAPADPCRFGGSRCTIADVMRSLDADGFDVGLHGSFHSATDEQSLIIEKQILEEATGLSVSTTRQHFLHWDVRVTPRRQESAGFLADSSLGFNRNVGFRAGTSLPFRPLDLEAGRPLQLLEVPLIVQDGPLLNPNALELDLGLAKKAVAQLIDSVASVGGVATLLFHPNNLERPDFLALYRWSIEYGLERNGWVTSLKAIANWWRDRERRLATT